MPTDKYHTHYVCNECAATFPILEELQLHLQRKTAWSDKSLVGCRISCLIDNREWHEGFVQSYNQNSKHLIDFHLIGERRWLNMKKIAFYISERPSKNSQYDSEYKDNEDEDDNLAPIDDYDDWVYVEDISLEYSFAQSVLYKVFNSGVQETGHKTKGHICLTDGDKSNAKFSKGSLLYGELLPRGANKSFGRTRLDVSSAKTLYDLGMGTGKIPMQAFLQFSNLEYVYGVELSQGRYNVAEEAALSMINLLGKDSFHVQMVKGQFIIITEKISSLYDVDTGADADADAGADAGDENGNSNSNSNVTSIATAMEFDGGDTDGNTDMNIASNNNEQCKNRTLHFECGNLFDTPRMDLADVVMLETDIPASTFPQFCHFMNQMKVGSRILSYLDLYKIWCYDPFPFKQLDINRKLSDRFPTSWSVQRGHHFFLWNKMQRTEMFPLSMSSSSDIMSSNSNGNVNSDASRRGNGRSRKRSDRGHDDDTNQLSMFGCLPSFNLLGGIFSSRGKKSLRNVAPIAPSDDSNSNSSNEILLATRQHPHSQINSDLKNCITSTTSESTFETAVRTKQATPQVQVQAEPKSGAVFDDCNNVATPLGSPPHTSTESLVIKTEDEIAIEPQPQRSPSGVDSQSMQTPIHLKSNSTQSQSHRDKALLAGLIEKSDTMAATLSQLDCDNQEQVSNSGNSTIGFVESSSYRDVATKLSSTDSVNTKSDFERLGNNDTTGNESESENDLGLHHSPLRAHHSVANDYENEQSGCIIG